MTLPKKRLGRDGPEVSVVSLGSAATWNRMYYDDGLALLKTALERGVTFFDVGVYGIYVPPEWKEPSFSDVIFGRLLEASGTPRAEVQVAHKIWPMRWPHESLAVQLDKALERAGTEYADALTVYDNHDPAFNMRAFVNDIGALIASGKARSWGFCNWSADEARAAIAYAKADGMPRPQYGQLRYSIARRAIAEGEPYAALFDDGFAMQASYVLEGGFLAGRTPESSSRKVFPDVGDVRPLVTAARPQLQKIADELDATLGQLAIAFSFTHRSTATVLFGCTSIEQLDHNLAAWDLYQRHGDRIRSALAEFACDKGRVSPNASYGVEPTPFAQPDFE